MNAPATVLLSCSMLPCSVLSFSALYLPVLRSLVLLGAMTMLLLPASRAETDRAAIMALSASVLQIEALRAQGGFSLGSGVVVGPEQIVTNCHVTRDALKISVVRGGGRWLASSQLADLDHDLCLLRIPGLRADTVRLGRADALTIGQPVTAIGFTGGGMQNSAGEVLALHRLDGSRVIQSSNWFNSGASGGGLFDEDLRLVGILTFRLRGGEAHYFAAPVEWLSRMQGPGADGFRPVAPHAPGNLAYWQRPAASQPPFLQAARLQRDNEWAGLETLTLDWLRSDETDPQAWYLMGMALEGLGRLPQARHAFECSLRIEPGLTGAATHLAVVHGRLLAQTNGSAPQAPADRSAGAVPDTAAQCSAASFFPIPK